MTVGIDAKNVYQAMLVAATGHFRLGLEARRRAPAAKREPSPMLALGLSEKRQKEEVKITC
jgi:hypothetical protein